MLFRSEMIENVCVPGGSTEKGMKSLKDAGFDVAIRNGVRSSLRANKAMGVESPLSC